MGASIYIADDEKNIRDLITKFLECDGYSVTAFETGDELMEEFLKKPCELVILDIMMPGTDGLTICRQLRTITDVPIIMLTAKDSEYDYVRGITLGGDDYLTKPFRLTTLLMRVKSLLRRMDMNTKKVTGQELYELKSAILDFRRRKTAFIAKASLFL
jgi:DNA-binding response OmpR family regulator